MLVQRYSKLKLVSDFKFGSEWGHLLFQLCYNYEWKSKAVLAIMKKPIWLLQQTTKMKGCTIFKIHFNISDPTPRPILNVHSTQMPPKIADKLWKLLETLPTSLGGWESFGTDLQLVFHNLPDFSSRNAKLQHPEDLQLLQIWAKCQSFNIVWLKSKGT